MQNQNKTIHNKIVRAHKICYTVWLGAHEINLLSLSMQITWNFADESDLYR